MQWLGLAVILQDIEKAKEFAGMSAGEIWAMIAVVESSVILTLCAVIYKLYSGSQKRERELTSILLDASKALDSQIRVLEKTPEEIDDMREFLERSISSLRSQLDHIKALIIERRPFGQERRGY